MTYFYRFDNPKNMRLNLLEAAKDSLLIISLKNKMSITQQRKNFLSQKLNAALREIESDMNSLNSKLPNKEILREPDYSPREKTSSQKKYVPMQKNTEEDRLEYSLQSIEKKLQQLKDM